MQLCDVQALFLPVLCWVGKRESTGGLRPLRAQRDFSARVLSHTRFRNDSLNACPRTLPDFCHALYDRGTRLYDRDTRDVCAHRENVTAVWTTLQSHYRRDRFTLLTVTSLQLSWFCVFLESGEKSREFTLRVSRVLARFSQRLSQTCGATRVWATRGGGTLAHMTCVICHDVCRARCAAPPACNPCVS